MTPQKNRRQHCTDLLIAATVCALVVTSCFAGKGEKPKDEAPQPAPKEANASQSLGGSGIIFTFPDHLDKSSITIKITGQDNLEITPISPNDPEDLGMAVRGLASGRYDAYITAKARGNSQEHAAYITGIEVGREEFANYNLTHFTPSSTVKGQVRVIGHSQHDNVSLAVLGLPAKATTDSEGNFTLPYLPQGTYTVLLSRDDLRSGRLTEIVIDQDQVDLGIIAMKKTVEFQGLVTIHEVKAASTTGHYLLDMVIADTKSDAKFIKFNHQDNGWDGFAWQPFRTSIQAEWFKNSSSQVYIQIANKDKKVLVKQVKTVQMQPAVSQ